MVYHFMKYWLYEKKNQPFLCPLVWDLFFLRFLFGYLFFSWLLREKFSKFTLAQMKVPILYVWLLTGTKWQLNQWTRLAEICFVQTCKCLSIYNLGSKINNIDENLVFLPLFSQTAFSEWVSILNSELIFSLSSISWLLKKQRIHLGLSCHFY